MNLFTIETGFFKLDGGAMFGVVPKTIWQKLNQPDANNLCTWTMRCLLIVDGKRVILVDTGMGNKQSEKFFSYYEPHGDATMESSLNKAGFTSADVTDVILTHLHFDHCGGAVSFNEKQQLVPTFKNATYWSSESHWDWALNPNPREKASFLKENIIPIQESGQLKFAEEGELFPGINLQFYNGHTESMIVPLIEYKNRTVAYMADLLPSAAHIPTAYVMAYDVRPLVTFKEKQQFLAEAMEKDYVLFFEHDKDRECCTLQQTEKGIRMDKSLQLSEL